MTVDQKVFDPRSAAPVGHELNFVLAPGVPVVAEWIDHCGEAEAAAALSGMERLASGLGAGTATTGQTA